MLVNMDMFGQNVDISQYVVLKDETPTGSTSHTLQNMAGKKILLLVFSWSASAQSYTTFDNIQVSDGSTFNKICNLVSQNAVAYGTFFQIDVKTDNCVLTTPTGTIIAFGVN